MQILCWLVFAATCVHAAVRFETNQGQADVRARFFSKDAGYDLLLTSRGAEFRFDSNQHVCLQFQGANPRPAMRGLDLQPGVTNYLLGSDRSRWVRGVRSYGRVEYADVYPGVNIVFYGGPDGSIEYDVAISPGVDFGKVRLKLTGAQSVRLDQGDLVIKIGDREIRQRRPAVYQGKQRIECNYSLHGREFGLRLGAHDRGKALVIDPVLIYSTPVFDRNASQPKLALDRDGNVYITAGAGDILVAKFDQHGQPVYSTHFGGGEPYGIAIDSDGNAVVVGLTYSSDFPLQYPLAGMDSPKGGNYTGFIAKLNQDGNDLVYSTYLGGNGDVVTGIALDQGNNIFVTGSTASQRFPTVRAIQTALPGGTHAFVSKISADGSQLLFSTYLGGSSHDSAVGIAVDSAGNAYVAGFTQSADFPTLNALQPQLGSPRPGLLQEADAFIAKVDTNVGALVYSTYLGGSGEDVASGIAIDSAGDVYVCGYTQSQDFPAVNALQSSVSGAQKAFVTKLDASGRVILYSSQFGGSGTNDPQAIALDRFGNAFVTGLTGSVDFPLVSPIQTDNGFSFNDAFVSVIGPSGNFLVYSTYLGGHGQSRGYGIAVDTNSIAYIAGETDAPNFPVHHAAQSVLHGGIFLTALSIQPIRSLPFGAVDSPPENTTVFGAVPITGWALDATGILKVDLWRDPQQGEPQSGLIYLEDALQYQGTRPDVQSAYPNYPDNDRAGWGTLLLTNHLTDGAYRIYAYTHNVGGATQLLGARTIIVANAANPLPFGAIDTPAEGDTISGSSFVNFGWALTPPPAFISSITVFIDLVQEGQPTFGGPRYDVDRLFPSENNSAAAGGFLVIDTTKLTNGPHTISWTVTDSVGRTQGIGSRVFYVRN